MEYFYNGAEILFLHALKKKLITQFHYYRLLAYHNTVTVVFFSCSASELDALDSTIEIECSTSFNLPGVCIVDLWAMANLN